jgi:parallel beta-helix repeat protein
MRVISLVLAATLIASTASAEVLTVTNGQSIQSAINRARPGDTIRIEPGLYKETVYVDKDNLRISGVIRAGEWPVMDGETTRNDGILVSGHGVTVERMHVKRYMGNGIMTQGSNNFQVIGNRVEGPGFYGIFPQYGKNGLVSNNVVYHIKGTAIYVGMSQNIDITYNETYDNDGFGIEVENSNDALIEGNYTHGNTVGIVLNLIPGLPIKSQERMIVRNNFIVANNNRTDVHSAKTSASVIDSGAGQHPQGTGLLVNAADLSTIENNIFRDNPGAAIFIMDHNFGQLFPVPDPKIDPLPDNNRIVWNTFIGNGTKPYGRTQVLLNTLKRTAAPSLLMAGRGRKNCVTPKEAVTSLGAEDWAECPEGASSKDTTTMRLAKAVESPSLTLQQKGRLTYLAVCTGCHSFTTRIFGPPMMAARAPYMGNPQKLADWIAKPTKNRSDYPAMPPQAYLPPEVRLEVAKYVLGPVEP